MHFLKEKVRIAIKIPRTFARKGPVSNILALVQIMAWRMDKSLSEPVTVSLLTHICVTWPELITNGHCLHVSYYHGWLIIRIPPGIYETKALSGLFLPTYFRRFLLAYILVCVCVWHREKVHYVRYFLLGSYIMLMVFHPAWHYFCVCR